MGILYFILFVCLIRFTFFFSLSLLLVFQKNTFSMSSHPSGSPSLYQFYKPAGAPGAAGGGSGDGSAASHDDSLSHWKKRSLDEMDVNLPESSSLPSSSLRRKNKSSSSSAAAGAAGA